jgi:hypothetical protein
MMDRIAAPPQLLPPASESYATVLAFARSFESGPIAWFGESCDTTTAVAPPDFKSRPFRSASDTVQAGLSGLALPHPDGAFVTVVVADYWRALSQNALRFMCAEFTRIADVCIFASITSCLPGEHALPDALIASDFVVEETRISGNRMSVVRRGGGP